VQVNWTPFGVIHPDTVDRRLYTGLIRYREMVESYNPLRCLRQFGYIQSIPRAPPLPEVAVRGPKPEKYVVKFPSSFAQSMWNGFPEEHMINLGRRPENTATDDGTVCGYMEWFRSVSHPIISPDCTPDSVSGRDTLPAKTHSHYVSVEKKFIFGIFYTLYLLFTHSSSFSNFKVVTQDADDYGSCNGFTFIVKPKVVW